jgi:hypothetical protein
MEGWSLEAFACVGLLHAGIVVRCKCGLMAYKEGRSLDLLESGPHFQGVGCLQQSSLIFWCEVGPCLSLQRLQHSE